MKLRLVLTTLMVAGLFALIALATMPGKTVEYPSPTKGKVVFDGKIHADKSGACATCHPALFEMKKVTSVGGVIKVPDHFAGKKFCFACHNGTKSFKVDATTCVKCHKPA